MHSVGMCATPHLHEQQTTITPVFRVNVAYKQKKLSLEPYTKANTIE